MYRAPFKHVVNRFEAAEIGRWRIPLWEPPQALSSSVLLRGKTPIPFTTLETYVHVQLTTHVLNSDSSDVRLMPVS
jgi:hypothetical protein